MSYVQIEIGGKLRGLKFNNKALREFSICLVKGLKFITDDNIDEINSETIYATFYGGLVGNCYVKREEPDFTFSDVVDWVDTLYAKGEKETIIKVCDAFYETEQYKTWFDGLTEKIRGLQEDNKKKVLILTEPQLTI